MSPHRVIVVAGWWIGIALIVIGLTRGDDATDAVATPTTTTTTTIVDTTTTAAASTTTAAPATTAPPTTTVAETSTTSTTTTSTTTTTPPSDDELVAAFLADYVNAIAAGDADFLEATLDPLVVAQADAATCRAFIERDILALTDYSATGDPDGPTTRELLGATFDRFFTVPVSFVFQGQAFDDQAAFAVVDATVTWFATCR